MKIIPYVMLSHLFLSSKTVPTKQNPVTGEGNGV